jgi:hypothetical protein
MRIALLGIVVVHGLIHLMGFAKAFGLAELPALTRPISRPVGLAWLLAALLLTAAGAMLLVGSGSWWWVGLPALLLSELVIVSSWRDARFGTVANLVILVPLVAAIAEAQPGSYGNRYRAAAREGLGRSEAMPILTETDLAALPVPVQKYLRVVGAVGKPRVHSFRAVFTGEFRNGLKGRWMPFESEQVNITDPPSRQFLMKASMLGVPMEGLHLFGTTGATMQIKVASLFQVVDARGPRMDSSETVTLFNDMCLLAPASLVDSERIRWQEAGPLSAMATFTHQGNTISARLAFNESGELVDFVSGDRHMSADGKTYQSCPWSTPVSGYRDLGGRRVPAQAETIWHMPEGPFTYGRFDLVEVRYNLNSLE